jgi:hypothetical protein
MGVIRQQPQYRTVNTSPVPERMRYECRCNALRPSSIGLWYVSEILVADAFLIAMRQSGDVAYQICFGVCYHCRMSVCHGTYCTVLYCIVLILTRVYLIR